jgi:hypothetical protein
MKKVNNKARSSKKFYSIPSVLLSFYKNVLDIVNLVKNKSNANENWKEEDENEYGTRTSSGRRRSRRSALKQQKQQAQGIHLKRLVFLFPRIGANIITMSV